MVLAHVRSGRQQQQVLRGPRELPPILVVGLGAGQGLGQPVAARLAHPEVRLTVRRQLVSLVEDDEVVGVGLRVLEVAEHALPGQGVDADDDEVALRAEEGVAGARLGAADDTEGQAEEGAHLPLPVADQAGRGHDEHAPQEPAGQHLAHVQTGHDRLAGAGVVGQQESQRGLLEHPLVHGDALMRERVDQRRLGGEGGIEEMAAGEAVRLGDGRDRLRIGGEVHARGPGWTFIGRGLIRPFCRQVLQFDHAPPSQAVGAGLSIFPAVDGGKGDADELRELRLGQTPEPPDVLDPAGVISGGSVR